MENDLPKDKDEAQEQVEASEARFSTVMRHSPALAFIKDESGEIVYVNNPSEDAEEIAAQLLADASVFESGEPSRTVEVVKTAGGPARQMLCFRFLFNDAGGRKLLGGISVDITEQKDAEQALLQALAGKDVLLREVHHRVKNNLQTISSLLNMQADLLPDVAARQALRDAQRRVHSMSLIHEQMYGDKDMDEVDFGEYARRLTRDLFESFGVDDRRVRLRFTLDLVSLAMDQMIPCGLILNELVTNSLKYAFPGELHGEILVSLRCGHGRSVTMAVTDNGVGLPPAIAGKQESLGTRIVEILTKQLGGTLVRRSENGLSTSVTFTRSDRLNPNRP
jgi:two-component sensor histidine kinase